MEKVIAIKGMIKELFVEDNNADVKANRDEGEFCTAWDLGENGILTVERIPSNYPSLTVRLDKEDTLKRLKVRLKEAGFKINRR